MWESRERKEIRDVTEMKSYSSLVLCSSKAGNPDTVVEAYFQCAIAEHSKVS